jgi:hypothetical protein
VYSRDLPMTSRAVFPRRGGTHLSPGPGGITPPLDSFQRPNISQSETLQVWKSETAARARNVSQGVASHIPIIGRVRSRSDADTIEDDDGRTPQRVASV